MFELWLIFKVVLSEKRESKKQLILAYTSCKLHQLELYTLLTAAFSLSKLLDYSFVGDKVEDADDPEIPDPSALTDDDLKTALRRHGVKVGPIVGEIPLGFMFYHR